MEFRLAYIQDLEQLKSMYKMIVTNMNDNQAKALYIDRFGVDVKYLEKGIGSRMIVEAKETTKTVDAEYLRLFHLDRKKVAVALRLIFRCARL